MFCKSANNKSVVLLNRLPHTLPRKELRSLFAGTRELRAKLWIVNEAADGVGEHLGVPRLHPDPTEVAGVVGAELGIFDPRLPVHDVDGEQNGVPLRYGAFVVPGELRVWGLTARLLCELAGRVAEESAH